MDKAIAREILVILGVALLAALLLGLARFAGIAFTSQTYLWSLGALYGIRVLVWALRAVRSGTRAVLPFIFALGMLLLVGCAGAAPTPTSIPPTPTPTPTPAPLASPSRFETLLGLIPDTAQARSSVSINDYAMVRDLFDIQVPGPDADEDALMGYLARLYGAPDYEDSCSLREAPWISGMASQYAQQFLENRHYLGFDLRNVDQTVQAGTPPKYLEVLVGRFDPEATDRGLNACDECPPPSRQDYQGVPFYIWGDDMEMNIQMAFSPPAFDQFGRGGRIAVQDNYVFRAVWTEGIEGLIDASLNQRASLADVEEFRLLAQGLSDLGACSGLLSDQTEMMDTMLQRTWQLAPLHPYQAFAWGEGVDEDGSFTALILVHPDTTSATENADLLTSAPADGDTDLRIQLEGRVLLAKLRVR